MLEKINLFKPLESLMDYPKEYNPRVHGPFNPATNYGKVTPLGEVKIGDLGSWISKRDWSLRNTVNTISRGM
jgi:F-type H+-transporting ATPase subunit f